MNQSLINQAGNGEARELGVDSVVNQWLTTAADRRGSTKTRPWAAAPVH